MSHSAAAASLQSASARHATHLLRGLLQSGVGSWHGPPQGAMPPVPPVPAWVPVEAIGVEVDVAVDAAPPLPTHAALSWAQSCAESKQAPAANAAGATNKEAANMRCIVSPGLDQNIAVRPTQPARSPKRERQHEARDPRNGVGRRR